MGDQMTNVMVVSFLCSRCTLSVDTIHKLSSMLCTTDALTEVTDFKNIFVFRELINLMTEESRNFMELKERREAMLRGARRQLENEYYRFMKSMILENQRNSVLEIFGKFDTIKAFLRVFFYEQDKLDFDGGSVSTFWPRIFYCIRSGLLDEHFAMDRREEIVVSDLIWLFIDDWNQNGGQLSPWLALG